MKKQSYPSSSKAAQKNNPWPLITLSFLMTTSFLIFASVGLDNTEFYGHWTHHISEILVGTLLFSLASLCLIWAVHILPKDFSRF
ncbi:MAG: hypothetical protein K9G26_01400 [Emcibacter sp.]|nr:hypothetical protein [Emcibacter sp.]